MQIKIHRKAEQDGTKYFFYRADTGLPLRKVSKTYKSGCNSLAEAQKVALDSGYELYIEPETGVMTILRSTGVTVVGIPSVVPSNGSVLSIYNSIHSTATHSYTSAAITITEGGDDVVWPIIAKNDKWAVGVHNVSCVILDLEQDILYYAGQGAYPNINMSELYTNEVEPVSGIKDYITQFTVDTDPDLITDIYAYVPTVTDLATFISDTARMTFISNALSSGMSSTEANSAWTTYYNNFYSRYIESYEGKYIDLITYTYKYNGVLKYIAGTQPE